ncbi:LacI family transcriptional regulator [[Pantoea] beijingensis]|uniref:LacI family transcriptional regulator n=1 Tax=[Pantoea] beijingensis TaxID=1324864 RepID=A0A443IAC3_9GAMM|nr:LacI family DNA-binding transcriptional regulator [[Pantoea] beijingensis]RWR00965.1 LacI family transcriptional regulator [[Pantoea] beijingensis]
MSKTVEQIATALSLSVTTVRLVLNGKAEQHRISAKTRARIATYVDRYGYTVNHTARSLKLNKTDTLGLILPHLTSPFFSALTEKLEMRCRENGYQLMIGCSYDDSQQENQLLDSLAQHNVDGLFIVPSTRQSQESHIKHRNRPMIVLDRDVGRRDRPLVVSDNLQGSEMLTEAMLQAGVKPALFMAGDIQHPVIRERILGYRNALRAAGLTDTQEGQLADCHNRCEDGARIMRQYLHRHPQPPDAFIASSLAMLEGALRELRGWCGHIPPHIHIGTFEEHAMLGFLPNTLWSVRQNEHLWAQHAFDAMQQALAGDRQPQKHVIPMSLMYRAGAVMPE